MSRVCEICGKGPSTGNVIVRKGSPKYKGGIGLHTTGITKRRFLPNLQTVRTGTARPQSRAIPTRRTISAGAVPTDKAWRKTLSRP